MENTACNSSRQYPVRVHQGTAYRYIEDSRHAPTILFVHGVGLDQSLWHPWLNRLVPDFSLITLDLFGHGQSEDRPGLSHIEDFVKQIDELVEFLCIGRFALVGFSLGALISLAYASMRTAPSHLVLLHPVYRRNQDQLRQVQDRLKVAREQGPDAYIEIALKRWFTESYRHARKDIMGDLRKIFRRNSDGYLRAYQLFAEADREMHTHDRSQVKCPVLVITGSDDTGSTPTMSEQLAQDLPYAQHIINPGHRHMAPLEFAETLCEQTRSFLIENRNEVQGHQEYPGSEIIPS